MKRFSKKPKMSVRCDLAFFRLLGRSMYNNIWVVKGKCMIVWLFFPWYILYMPCINNQHGSICQDWWISEGMGMTNLFRNTAVTSVSILQENCDGVKIFSPKLYICIFYSKANKSKLKKNIIFIDICRKKLQWPVTQLGPFNKEQTERHFLQPECFFWFILW